jgi:hypothetical protein
MSASAGNKKTISASAIFRERCQAWKIVTRFDKEFVIAWFQVENYIFIAQVAYPLHNLHLLKCPVM